MLQVSLPLATDSYGRTLDEQVPARRFFLGDGGTRESVYNSGLPKGMAVYIFWTKGA
jgi:hypothetical protein